MNKSDEFKNQNEFFQIIGTLLLNFQLLLISVIISITVYSAGLGHGVFVVAVKILFLAVGMFHLYDPFTKFDTQVSPFVNSAIGTFAIFVLIHSSFAHLFYTH